MISTMIVYAVGSGEPDVLVSHRPSDDSYCRTHDKVRYFLCHFI